MMTYCDLTSLESGALFRARDGALYCGTAPFRALETAPAGELAFYTNTYGLEDPCPWKVPARLERVSEEGELPPAPEIAWEPPPQAAFAEVFREIKAMLASKRLKKTVPAMAEQGRLVRRADARLLAVRACLDLPGARTYAFWSADEGFAGLSPEALFTLQGRRLETMALAGTAARGESGRLTADRKELTEHRIVVDAVRERLASCGRFVQGQRRVRTVGALAHLYTPISLEADEEHPPEFWLKRLHPTPALGPYPRTPETLKTLAQWRRRLHCPDTFGAPFGLLREGSLEMFTVLRGVSWKGQLVSLTSGGGIVAASDAGREWAEFSLKRRSIAQTLGLLPASSYN